MKTNNTVIALFCALALNTAHAKPVEYIENIYLLPATSEITQPVNTVATQIGITQDFEVAIPKKAGLQINPWNSLIASGKRQTTGNLFIIINPEWFNQLTKEEQNFLITRAFLFAQCGGSSLPIKTLPWLLMVLNFLVIWGLFFALGKYSKTAQLNKWIRVAIAIGIVGIFNATIGNKLQLRIIVYFNTQLNNQISRQALEKSGVRTEVGVQALTRMDTAVKEHIKAGEVFWKPFENAFQQQIQALK